MKAQAVLHVAVRLRAPAPGVAFAIQRGRNDLLGPSCSGGDAPSFSFSLRLGSPRDDGAFNFLGEFAQGTPTDRFVYINSGIRAGQSGSPWERRAKLKLASLPRPLVETAAGDPDHAVEATVVATMEDGSPVCGTVKPHAVAWRLVTRSPDPATER